MYSIVKLSRTLLPLISQDCVSCEMTGMLSYVVMRQYAVLQVRTQAVCTVTACLERQQIELQGRTQAVYLVTACLKRRLFVLQDWTQAVYMVTACRHASSPHGRRC